MSNQHVAQSQEMKDDDFLSNVGSLLTQRVADGPSLYEAQVAANFASYLRNRRQQLGLTQAEVAQRAEATEFELYALEQSMLLPRQIEYALLQKLASALEEDVALFALILERDIVRTDDHNAQKRNVWMLGEWMSDKQEMIQQFLLSVQSAARTIALSSPLSTSKSNSYAVGLICFALFFFGVQSFWSEPLDERSSKQASAPEMSVDPEWVTPAYVFEQRGPLEIVYADKDSVWPEHMAYFMVDQQYVATVLYVGEPARLNRWGCDVSLGNAYGPCTPALSVKI